MKLTRRRSIEADPHRSLLLAEPMSTPSNNPARPPPPAPTNAHVPDVPRSAHKLLEPRASAPTPPPKRPPKTAPLPALDFWPILTSSRVTAARGTRDVSRVSPSG